MKTDLANRQACNSTSKERFWNKHKNYFHYFIKNTCSFIEIVYSIQLNRNHNKSSIEIRSDRQETRSWPVTTFMHINMKSVRAFSGFIFIYTLVQSIFFLSLSLYRNHMKCKLDAFNENKIACWFYFLHLFLYTSIYHFVWCYFLHDFVPFVLIDALHSSTWSTFCMEIFNGYSIICLGHLYFPIWFFFDDSSCISLSKSYVGFFPVMMRHFQKFLIQKFLFFFFRFRRNFSISLSSMKLNVSPSFRVRS